MPSDNSTADGERNGRSRARDNERCPKCGNELKEFALLPFDPHGPMRYECLSCQYVWTESELEAEKDAE